MVPHLFRAELTGTGQTVPFKPAGPGTRISAQALVEGAGAVSASVKVQGSNTPSLDTSWVDLDTLVPSGTNAGVDFGEIATAFTAFRFDCTALTGSKLTVSIGRG